MRRIILDTNIYEFMLKEMDAETLHTIAIQKEIIIYGNEIIRKELRNTPKEKIGLLGTKLIKLRTALLGVYGGNISKDKIINDLLIVSFASIKKLDIVISEDVRSMLSDAAKHAYAIVNEIENLRVPSFIRFDEFSKEIRRYVS